jgi:hypothetical protein
VLHYRADWFDATVQVAPTEAAEPAKILRARAGRYRELAKTLYDEDLIRQVEALARELDETAARSEVGTYPFFEEALRKRG